MHRHGWNPTRRNRNIGTDEQGAGRNNRLEIPRIDRDKKYYERVVNPTTTFRVVHGKRIKFLIEATRQGFRHSCTVDDIASLLAKMPPADIDGIGLIVLRQPTFKQNVLCSVWGRICFKAIIGRYTGPAIFIEAVCTDKVFKWSRSLTPFWRKELDRLKMDGHPVVDNGKEYLISYNAESVRNTQLYRTLPHEVGHYVDYMAGKSFNNKTETDKEAFAHRYAEEFRLKIFDKGLIRDTV